MLEYTRRNNHLLQSFVGSALVLTLISGADAGTRAPGQKRTESAKTTQNAKNRFAKAKLTKREKGLLGSRNKPHQLLVPGVNQGLASTIARGVSLLGEGLATIDPAAPIADSLDVMRENFALWQEPSVRALVKAARQGKLNFDDRRLVETHAALIPVLRHIQDLPANDLPTAPATNREKVQSRAQKARAKIFKMKLDGTTTLAQASYAGVLAPQIVRQSKIIASGNLPGQTPRGIFIAEPGRVGSYEGAVAGKQYKVPRHINRDGAGESAYVLDRVSDAGLSPRYSNFLAAADDSIEIGEFDRMMYEATPTAVLKEIERVMDTSVALYKVGRGQKPPKDRDGWRRSLVMSYLHSRDLSAIMTAMGYPRTTTGLHDVSEFVPAEWLQDTRLDKADPWFVKLTNSFDPKEPVNVGGLGGYTAVGFDTWGYGKEGHTQDIMDWHRASPHHSGHPQEPIEVIERFVNFVVHHGPREHLGIRKEARGDLNYVDGQLAHALEVDTAIKDFPIGKEIAKDAAFVVSVLEKKGYVLPWQKLKVPANAKHHEAKEFRVQDPQSKSVREDALKKAATQEKRLSPRNRVRTNAVILRNLISKMAAVKPGVLREQTQPADAEKLFSNLAEIAQRGTERALVQRLGTALVATYEELAGEAETYGLAKDAAAYRLSGARVATILSK